MSAFRWLNPFRRAKAAVLPQNDNYKEQRRMHIDKKRELYQFEFKSHGMPAQIVKVPRREKFSIFYRSRIVGMFLKLYLSKYIKIWSTREWRTINDMKEMFDWSFFKHPTDYDRWDSDRKFGLQRLDGVNNLSIKLCESIPDKVGVTSDMIEPFLEGSTLTDALKNKKIFIVDHEILDKCPTNNTHVCAPIALFYQHECGALEPIAIQLAQDKERVPVFLPSDNPGVWIMAKMWFNNADAQVHQAVTHLCSTHLLMEGVVIVTHRNLSEDHPLFKLLAPHFFYTIAINNLAREKLIEPGGFFDETMSVGVDGANELVKRKKKEWKLDVDWLLPNDLKKRGLEDQSCLPAYHFREDALELYEAIKQYVTSYVHLYYVEDTDVQADWEVQDWRKEMVQTEENAGIGLGGVPGTEDKFTDRDQLILTLTGIIYTCSVGHAGVNFAMYEEYSFAPNYPSFLYESPPRDKTPLKMQDIMACMPGKEKIYDQLIISYVLSRRDTKSLGHFEKKYITDPRAREILHEFQKDLSELSNANKNRNMHRLHPYYILDPEQIPNAISI